MLGYMKQGLAYLPLAVLLVGIWRITRKGKKNVLYEAGLWAFIVYLTILFSQTVSPIFGFQLKLGGRINLRPFSGIGAMLATIIENPRNMVWAAMNIMGNVVMFLPFGFLLPTLWKRYRKGYQVVFLGFCTSFMIETLQLLTQRGTDIDDLILNTLGTLLGWWIYCCLQFIFPKCFNKVHEEKRRELFLCIGISLLSVMLTGFYQRMPHPGALFADKRQEQTTDAWRIEEAAGSNEDLVAAEAAIKVCVEDNRVLYSKNAKEFRYPASTTKLVSALTAINLCSVQSGKDWKQEVVVGDEIGQAPSDSSTAGLQKGQKLTFRMLMEGMLLPSGGDAAYTLAVYAGRAKGGAKLSSQEAIAVFVEEMNRVAKELKATDSVFRNPDGYDEEGQHTTALDMAKIAKACLEEKTLAEIVGTKRTRAVFLDGTDYTWENTNEMLQTKSPYYMKTCIGLKTGFTNLAGYSLVAAEKKWDKTYIYVIYGSTKEGRFSDTKQLFALS